MVDDFIAFLQANGESRLALRVAQNRAMFEAVASRLAPSDDGQKYIDLLRLARAKLREGY